MAAATDEAPRSFILPPAMVPNRAWPDGAAEELKSRLLFFARYRPKDKQGAVTKSVRLSFHHFQRRLATWSLCFLQVAKKRLGLQGLLLETWRP